jgi:trehalose 6-phosphate phosphatase
MIARFAADRGLLVFDFDGTLAPIVQDRTLASMRPVTRGLLRVAALLYPCAVISGRDRKDVATRLTGVPLADVVGNHGADTRLARPDARTRIRVRSWVGALETALRDAPGVDIEAKAFSVADHTRSAGLSADQNARIAALASRLPGSRVFGGDGVVNVVPLESPSKGDAVEDLARRHRARSVMFVGDDVTDEDAFRSPVVTCSICVGRAHRSAALWFLEGQRQVDALLLELVKARARHAFGEDWLRGPDPSRGGGDG